VAKKQVADVITKPNPRVASKATTFEPVRPMARLQFQGPVWQTESVPIITIIIPNQNRPSSGPTDKHLDPKLTRAATIAQERAMRTPAQCAGIMSKKLARLPGSSIHDQKASMPGMRRRIWSCNYGFKKLSMRDPFARRIGSVLVYGPAAASVTSRSGRRTVFVSDFRSPTPRNRPLIGVYAKL